MIIDDISNNFKKNFNLTDVLSKKIKKGKFCLIIHDSTISTPDKLSDFFRSRTRLALNVGSRGFKS